MDLRRPSARRGRFLRCGRDGVELSPPRSASFCLDTATRVALDRLRSGLRRVAAGLAGAGLDRLLLPPPAAPRAAPGPLLLGRRRARLTGLASASASPSPPPPLRLPRPSRPRRMPRQLTRSSRRAPGLGRIGSSPVRPAPPASGVSALGLRRAGARVGFSASLSNVIRPSPRVCDHERGESLAVEHAPDDDLRLLTDERAGAGDDHIDPLGLAQAAVRRRGRAPQLELQLRAIDEGRHGLEIDELPLRQHLEMIGVDVALGRDEEEAAAWSASSIPARRAPPGPTMSTEGCADATATSATPGRESRRR